MRRNDTGFIGCRRQLRTEKIPRVIVIALCIGASFGTLLVAADPIQEFRPATPGYQYVFPRDHGSHDDFRTEWWYYTGHLTAKNGRRFGYQLTFFRRGIPRDQVKTLPSQWSVTHLYLAHFAISDLTGEQFHYAELISRAGLGKAGAERDRLHVWIDQWSAESTVAGPLTQKLRASNGTIGIQFTLSPEKSLVLHGTDGVSRKGSASGQASHYYSFTRLATAGTLSLGAEQFDVTGTSWMDHEFGSADLGPDLAGWDWFSIQLENGTDLMLYRLRRADGSADPASSGTLVDRDGRTQHLTVKDFSMEPTAFWTSPRTTTRYPQRWHIVIPSLNLSLDIVPQLAGQELVTSRSAQVTYWEGAVEITGFDHGRPVRGQGYMELTGYAERISQKL
jgi:predicted secreted hydrolase